MRYFEAPGTAYVLPVLLAVVWLLLWRAGRRARLWFLLGAPVASVLCIPIGVAVGLVEMSSLVCATQAPECSSMYIIDVWLNAYTGLWTSAALGPVTLTIEAVLLLRRRRS